MYGSKSTASRERKRPESSGRLRSRLASTFLLLLLGNVPPASAQAPALVNGDAASLAAEFRALILANLPPVLYEDHKHWDEQKLVTRGIEWKGHNPIPQKQKKHKNHGIW